jgi:hypothetical protein
MGVSKRCCPTCDHFLDLLRPGHDQFLVRGRHGKISACTLPPWTPSLIVDSMNFKFGTMLVQDLNFLKDQVNGIQGRALERSISSGSGTLSVDSDEGRSDGPIRGNYPVEPYEP